ncbi:MAG: hypothetical protein ACFE0Q_08780 [Anaerolineae bacterium]
MSKVRVLFLMVALLLFALPLQAQDVEIESITFARDVTFGNITPLQADTIFPNTLTVVYAVVTGEGIEPGESVDILWLFEGDEVDSLTWENTTESDEFAFWTNWSDPIALDEGDWAVEVYYDGDLIESAEMTVTDDPYIFPLRFAQDCGRETGQLLNEGDVLEDLDYVYVYAEFVNFDEQQVRALWSIDDEIFDLDIETEFDGDDWLCFFLTNGGDPLPSGDYRLIITDEDGDELRESHEVEIN